jgi:murein DD-endopeptidase MepM/ murein hydrolase activator NlpD
VAQQAAAGHGLQLELPLACDMARDCSIQKYVDRAPGAERRDYRCGTLTTDGHDGTDLRLRRFADFGRTVKVLAAAPGTVLRVRDGMADISVRDPAAPALGDRLAGNAVVIGHGDGWETQYSHLRNGSISVRPGDRIAAGAPLGAVGLSGNTEYPHLHFELRKDGKPVDPFAAGSTTVCGGQPASLWSAAAARALAYRPTVVLEAGLSDAADRAHPSLADTKSQNVMKNPAILILWGSASGVQSGDVQKFRIIAPNGGVILARESEISRNSLLWVSYAGIRRPVGGWQPGKYSATYQLTRNGVSVGEQAMEKFVTG